MSKRTADQWRELFVTHKESGLSAAAFCREQGLCPKYFSLRRKQLGPVKTTLPSKPAPPSFIRAEVSLPDIPIELTWREARLRLPANVSPDWLSDFLKALS